MTQPAVLQGNGTDTTRSPSGSFTVRDKTRSGTESLSLTVAASEERKSVYIRDSSAHFLHLRWQLRSMIQSKLSVERERNGETLLFVGGGSERRMGV